MDWYQIKKYLYYTHDDFVRDIIALHLKKDSLTDIYNYICKTSLFLMEDRFKGLAECIEDNICNEIITLFLDKRPIIRWYLNSLDIHNKICDFFTGLSCLIDDNIFLLDNIIKEKPLVLMIFNPQTSPQIIEDTLSLQQAT